MHAGSQMGTAEAATMNVEYQMETTLIVLTTAGCQTGTMPAMTLALFLMVTALVALTRVESQMAIAAAAKTRAASRMAMVRYVILYYIILSHPIASRSV